MSDHDPPADLTSTFAEALNVIAVLGLPRALSAFSAEQAAAFKAAALTTLRELISLSLSLRSTPFGRDFVERLRDLLEALERDGLDSPDVVTAARAVIDASKILPEGGWAQLEAEVETRLKAKPQEE